LCADNLKLEKIIIIIIIIIIINLKCMVIPVIIGATGIVMRSLREN